MFAELLQKSVARRASMEAHTVENDVEIGAHDGVKRDK
jgi:hypothetical protein